MSDNIGNASGGSGSFSSYGERPSVGDMPVTGDDLISVGKIHNSTGVAIGRGSQAIVNNAPENGDIFGVFRLIDKLIEERPKDENVDKQDINKAVYAIERETSKGYAARLYRIEEALNFLMQNAPDVANPILTLLSSPSLTIDEEIRRWAERQAWERGIVDVTDGDLQMLLDKIEASKLDPARKMRAQENLRTLVDLCGKVNIPHEQIPPLLSELQKLLPPELRLEVIRWMTNSSKVPTAVKIMGRTLLM